MMTLAEQIAVLMRTADEAREQAEYHAREAATHLKRAAALGEVVATLTSASSSMRERS